VSNDTSKVLEWFVSLTAATQALEAQGISRSSLPFRSILQPFCGYILSSLSLVKADHVRSYYAFGFTLIMPFILGYSVFMPGNWDTTTFFFSYTIIGVLPILFIVLEGPTSYSVSLTIYVQLIRPKEVTFFEEERKIIDDYERPLLTQKAEWTRLRNLSTIDKCQKFHALCITSPHGHHLRQESIDLCTLYGGRRERILEDPSFPAVMGLIPVCQLERLKINKYHWSEVIVLDTNLLKDVDALYTVFSGSTEFDLSFEGIIGESSPFITNMSPPASGGLLSLLKQILDLPLPSLEHLNAAHHRSASYGQGENIQQYKTVVETKMAPLVARGSFSILNSIDMGQLESLCKYVVAIDWIFL
ncbi:uncharacterized protein EV420DRAFT_1488369, partial [Desarmillaria tabescens]